METLSDSGHPAAHSRKYLLTLTLGALGVVYGDIGTSPLYALRECFHGPHSIPATPENVMGVLSLVIWSLIVVISIKYCAFVLRADNEGEGGILSLMALIRHPAGAEQKKRRTVLVTLGLFGSALLYGDGVITPAISVLSAMEGLDVATDKLKPAVIPLTIVILVALFIFQKKGTSGIGKIFGPVTLVWFAVLAVLGVRGILLDPSVLGAVSPLHGLRFFVRNGISGFLVLGAVFLVVTGGEALYADMGHFGRRPIRLAWYAMVLPALLLNYLGQGALLLKHPEAAEHPFYHLAPAWALLPVVVLATAAACIASQAVISGAYSLTRQAVQLGFWPRVKIDHTSEREIGQIFIPVVNWALAVSCIALVLFFGSSSRLASAYGIAVTSTMAITTLLLYVVAREIWHWKAAVAVPLMAAFLVVDLAFFGANIVKVADGGWFPLAAAILIYTMMVTWKKGRKLLAERLQPGILPIPLMLESVAAEKPARVPGTAVFMDRVPEGTPPAFLHNLKHNKVVHKRVVFLTVETEDVPTVPNERRISIHDHGMGFWRVTVRYGYMETPDIPEMLAKVRLDGVPFKMMETTFFLGREALIATKRPGLPIWQEELFAWMVRNAARATSFFRIPPGRVVELGIQVEL